MTNIVNLIDYLSFYSLFSYITLYRPPINDDLMHSYVGNIIFCIMLELFILILDEEILLSELRWVVVFLDDLQGLTWGRIFGELMVGSYDLYHRSQWPVWTGLTIFDWHRVHEQWTHHWCRSKWIRHPNSRKRRYITMP